MRLVAEIIIALCYLSNHLIIILLPDFITMYSRRILCENGKEVMNQVYRLPLMHFLLSVSRKFEIPILNLEDQHFLLLPEFNYKIRMGYCFIR